MKKMIIFDLDGTLLNTLTTLKDTLNCALTAANLPNVSLKQTSDMIGRGIRNLILQASNNDERIDYMYDVFMDYYRENYLVNTFPYEGIVEVVNKLKEKYILGVISNKNGEISQKLIEHFFPNKFDFIIGDRMGFPRKPDPTVINYIMEKYGLTTADFIYIGDSEVDVQTIKNANLNGLVVCYGFRSEDYLRKMWDGPLLESPKEILDYVE